jgi:outer membrane receptor protein involved in Fe transport
MQGTLRNNHQTQKNLLRATTGLAGAVIGASILAASGAALAAPQDEDVQESGDRDVIVVTGSRLYQKDLVMASPVTVLDRAEIDQTGVASIGELLRELPVSGASPNESAGRGGDSSARIALRGLSPVNTLVLINGRRVLANGGGGLVDLNSIPFEAVERVEILQDGASAVYGSDAIAGVVNIIMRDSYDRLSLQAEYGQSTRNDLKNRELSVTYGDSFDRGGFVFNASWRQADGNTIADRPISRDPDWTSRNPNFRNFRDPLPVPASFTGLDPMDPDRELIILEGVQQATTLADFRDVNFDTGDAFNYWEYESSANDIETFNLWFNGHYDISNDISAFIEASYNHRNSFSFLAPDGFGAVFGDPVTVSANNDFNPFGVDLSATRTILEQPLSQRRVNDVDADTRRIVLGLRGEKAGWNWDMAYNYQRLDQFTDGGRGVVRSRLRQAAGDSDVCRALENGCVPLNLLGSLGSITPEMLEFISADAFDDLNSSLDSVTANVTGKVFTLPAGDLNVAFGAEYRREAFDQNFDSVENAGGFIFRGQSPDADPPTRKITEFYFETRVPLLADLPLINSLDVDFAVRYSHYNAFGGTTNPKVGVRWGVTDDLTLRGTYSTGFRAPTFIEAFGGQSRGFQTVNDPCFGADFATFPGCNGIQATSNITGSFIVTGGNPDLEPEEATNYTAGLVWTPQPLDGLTLTFDYYRIEKTNIIGTANVNFLIDQNARFLTFADRITRDAGNAVFEVIATRDNLLNQEITGFDVGLQYNTPETDIGAFTLRFDLTYLDSFKQSPAPLVAPVERVNTYSGQLGTLAPLRANGGLTWEHNNWTTTMSFRYVGSVVNTQSVLIDGKRLVADSHLENDIFVSYNHEPLDLRLSAGMENIFDNMPPFLEGNFGNGFDSTTFNSVGRFFFFRVDKDF